MERRRDPWAPFRLWVAITIGLYAIRAAFATQLPGAIPGYVLTAMILVAMLLALLALLRPGRVEFWRDGEPGLWGEIREGWRLRWGRRRSQE